MRRQLGVILIVAALAMTGEAKAQGFAGGVASSPYFGYGSTYGAPGYYGTAYGYTSFGYPRTYTAFSSPYGAGYGYGYAPASFLPGRFGVNLWRPGFVSPGYAYGSAYYRTFPIVPTMPPPPFGVYAPAYGPGGVYGW